MDSTTIDNSYVSSAVSDSQGDSMDTNDQQNQKLEDNDKPGRKFEFLKKPGFWIRVICFLFLISCIVVAFAVFKVHKHFDSFLEWVDDHQVSGAFVFSIVYIIATVLVLPATILSLGAGVVFKLGIGSLVVWISASIGLLISFLVCKFLIRDQIAKRAQQYRTWFALEQVITEEGWKLVLLLRLAPIIPFAMLNYCLGLTSVTFSAYAWSSIVGIIPGVFAYVYLGSLARSISEISKDSASRQKKTVSIISLAVSGVVILVILVGFTWFAKKRIKQKLDQVKAQEEEAANEADAEARNEEPAEHVVDMQQVNGGDDEVLETNVTENNAAQGTV